VQRGRESWPHGWSESEGAASPPLSRCGAKLHIHKGGRGGLRTTALLEQRTQSTFARPPQFGGRWVLPILLLSVAGAVAQIPPPLAPLQTPNFNPSSPLVVPQPAPVPVSPGTLSTLPGSVPESSANVAAPYSIMREERQARPQLRHRHRVVRRHAGVKHAKSTRNR
jgi:hypothetical protein